MTKRIIALLCTVAVIVVLIWLRYSQKETTRQVDRTFSSNPILKEENGTAASLPHSNSPTQIESSYTEKVQRAFEHKNVPVRFYGRVIDQNSNSLAGVRIGLRVRHWDIRSFGSTITVERETDTSGRFDVHGVTGDAFDIEHLEKAGYELEPYTQRTYGAVGGSLSEPVIFTMWSTNVHEQLITGNKSFPILPDGRIYAIDLAKGTITESGTGDVRVWIKRPEQITIGKRYDWSCEIAVVNGGLLPEANPNSSMYLAPADGYTTSFAYEQKAGSRWGDSTGTMRFFLRLQDKEAYGRLSIEVFAYYNNQIPARVRIQYAINPSGSRILR